MERCDTTMFCPKCGNKLADDARFCTSCGNQMGNTAPVPVQAPVQVPAPAPVQAPAPVYAPPPPPPAPAYNPAPPQPVQPVIPARPLRYETFGGTLPAVTIKLDAGESIYTQSGGMTWMDNDITMTTNMQGGFLKGLGRMVSGESLFMATYTSNADGKEIVIASSFPGSICTMNLTGNAIIAQKSAFLCAQPTVELSVHVNRSVGAGLFGGEGFIMQRFSGYGNVFLEIDGSLVEKVLAPGEKLKVDTGNVAAYEESVTYQAEMVKGFKNILFGGEGLFLTTLTGPGKVWLQTMTLPSFASRLIPYLPKPSSN